jgi:hypothetical protein
MTGETPLDMTSVLKIGPGVSQTSNRTDTLCGRCFEILPLNSFIKFNFITKKVSGFDTGENCRLLSKWSLL